MTRLHRIRIEPLTEESFAPFGELLQPHVRPPDFRGVASVGWRAGFEIDGTVEVMLLHTEFAGLRFGKLERHFNVTQSFVPVAGVPAAVVVAEPTDPDDPAAIPDPTDLRAFLLDGTAGYVLRRGTWHSLDRYPLYPGAFDVVMLTAKETTHELQTAPREQWGLTQVVDYREHQPAIEFQLELAS